MRAILVSAFGGPEVLVPAEVPDPKAGPGDVVVRLRAAGVNPVETYVRSGAYGHLPPLPYIPGADGAGDIVAVGLEVVGLRPGDRVYVAGAPSYAEMVCAPAEVVWPLADHLTYEQGAAIGIPYRTAYLALVTVTGARPGDRVLVRGGSGGVGTAAIQLARALGCSVVATAGSKDGRSLVIEEGAIAVAAHDDDKRLSDLADGRGYDVIVEMRADRNLDSDLHLLADGGRVAVVGSRGRTEIDPRMLLNRSSSIRGVFGSTAEERRRAHLAIGAGLAQRTLRPVVGRLLPLREAAEAHRLVLSPGARGKIVLVMV